MTQNKTKTQGNSDQTRAIALTYDGETVPFVSAAGDGNLADEILQLAREHNIPIYENPELIQHLAKLNLGDNIPETLYLAIAQIIAFVYYLEGKLPEGFEQNKAKGS